MIYLIGVDHSAQWDRTLPQTQEFEKYLKDQCQKLKINLLAEEWSKDCQKSGYKTTILQDIAGQQEISCVWVDADKVARTNSGYEKEAYWLAQLEQYLKNNRILLVIGSDHLKTFPDKLKKRKIAYKILAKRFDKDPSCLSISTWLRSTKHI